MSSQTVDATVPATVHTPKHAPPRSDGFSDWLRRAVPTALIVVGLGGLAYWGHLTEWTFVPQHPSENADWAQTGKGLTVVRREPAGPDNAMTLPGTRQRFHLVFPSAEAIDKAGIEIDTVWNAPMTEQVSASGEVLFDPNLVARLAPRASGTVWRVMKTTGDTVKAGEVLALIDAAAVGKAKAEFQQALVQSRLRQQVLANLAAAPGVIPERQRREAVAAARDAEVRLLGAEQTLANLGLPVRAADFERLTLDEVVRRMRLLGIAESLGGTAAKETTSNLVPIRAPFAGVVLSADLVAGEVVKAGEVRFVVVNPRRLWLTLHVNPQDVNGVALGKPVTFSPDGSRETFEGRVTWIGTAADTITRTIPVRAELANEAGKLRSSTLGTGWIVLRTDANALVVPPDAVQVFRGTPVVFVRHPDYFKSDDAKSFEARPVRTGARNSTWAEIRSGLRMEEIVATKGSKILLNELQRGVPSKDE